MTIKHIVKFFLLFVFVFQANAQRSDFNTIDFKKADQNALKYKNEKLTNLPDLAQKLTTGLTTDVERFRAIFKWVCSNVSNDYKLYSKNKRKRKRFQNDSLQLKEWNTKFTKIVFKKLRKQRKTLCTGYAYIIKELAKYANIRCKMIHGFARTSTIDVEELNTSNHSWNAVQLNGKWYLCDPTWASGIPDAASNVFQFDFNSGLFLTNPSIFAINHFPADPKWLLLDEHQPTFTMFLEAPILYGDAYLYFDSHEAPKKMHTILKKNETVTFKFKQRKPITKKDIHFILESNANSVKKYPEKVTSINEELTITHKFTNTGFYDVHLYIKNDLIATYTVQVQR